MSLNVGDFVVREGDDRSYTVTGFEERAEGRRVYIGNNQSTTTAYEEYLTKCITPCDVGIGDYVHVIRKIASSPVWKGKWVAPMSGYMDRNAYPRGFMVSGKSTEGVWLESGTLLFPYESLQLIPKPTPSVIKPGDYVRVILDIKETSSTLLELAIKKTTLCVDYLIDDNAYFHSLGGSIPLSKLIKASVEVFGIGMSIPNNPHSTLSDVRDSFSFAVKKVKLNEKEKVMSTVLTKLDGISDDEIFKNIQQLENEKEHLNHVKNKPKALVAKIAAIQADIDRLVKFSDDRGEKVNS